VVEVRVGDRLVRVGVSFLARPLVERLTDPEAWLPASAWASRQIKAYVPSRYAILHGGLPQTIERSRILSLLPAPAEDLLRAHDAVPRLGHIMGRTPSSFQYYVSDVTASEARAFAQALDDAELKRFLPAAQLGYRFEAPGTSVDPPGPQKPVQNEVFITLEPYLPHGESVCSACG
jgi:hypothetical protein